jgi:hypothetical protein
VSVLQAYRDGRLKARLITRSDELCVKRNPRRSSEWSSVLSSERVSFASIQRRSSEGLSHFSSGRGMCEEEPREGRPNARLYCRSNVSVLQAYRDYRLIFRLNSCPDE